MTKLSPFRYFRASPKIIRSALTHCVGFLLSFRKVQDLLHERGIEVIHTTEPIWQSFRSPRSI